MAAHTHTPNIKIPNIKPLLEREKTILPFQYNMCAAFCLHHLLGGFTQMNNVVKKAKMPREQLNLPILSYQVTDTWIDYLGYEQFGWWLKFHSWIDRSDSKYTENHIPYTLESVYEKLGVSQATFYRKIKVLWECGLIEIVEFEASERKSQKPKNIIVYEYPFHEIERRIKPLEKLRDWKKDYDSQSKVAGLKGGLMRKSPTKKEYPLNSERVEKPVDKYPLKTERVDPLNSERVTLSELRANNYTNKLLINTNNFINSSNNLLSNDDDEKKEEIEYSQIGAEQAYLFTEFVAEMKYKLPSLFDDEMFLAIYRQMVKQDLDFITYHEAVEQAKFMKSRRDSGELQLADYAAYFVGGIKKKRTSEQSALNKRKLLKAEKELAARKEAQKEAAATSEIPWFNWLENPKED